MIPIYIVNPTTSNITANYVTPRVYDNRSIVFLKETICTNLNSSKQLKKNAIKQYHETKPYRNLPKPHEYKFILLKPGDLVLMGYMNSDFLSHFKVQMMFLGFKLHVDSINSKFQIENQFSIEKGVILIKPQKGKI
jgi:hypothetical protein